MVASGGKSGRLAAAVAQVGDGLLRQAPVVRENADFFDIAAEAAELKPDLVIGHSKGYRVIAKEWNVPLVRVGFPIHDRFGGQRILHVGYRGTQALFDRLVNAVIAQKQSGSDIGYGYI
jgi:nitrogenase molybdenum-iron protein NifN